MFYNHFALLFWCFLHLCALVSAHFLALCSFHPFPFHWNVYGYVVEQRCLWVHWVYHLFLLLVFDIFCSVSFWHFVPEVFFYQYGDGLHMSPYPSESASSLCHPLFVASSLWSSVPCPTMVGSPILSLYCNSWFVGRKEIFLWVSKSLLTFHCLFTRAVWLLSSLLHGLSTESWQYATWHTVEQDCG